MLSSIKLLRRMKAFFKETTSYISRSEPFQRICTAFRRFVREVLRKSLRNNSYGNISNSWLGSLLGVPSIFFNRYFFFFWKQQRYCFDNWFSSLLENHSSFDLRTHADFCMMWFFISLASILRIYQLRYIYSNVFGNCSVKPFGIFFCETSRAIPFIFWKF